MVLIQIEIIIIIHHPNTVTLFSSKNNIYQKIQISNKIIDNNQIITLKNLSLLYHHQVYQAKTAIPMKNLLRNNIRSVMNSTILESVSKEKAAYTNTI